MFRSALFRWLPLMLLASSAVAAEPSVKAASGTLSAAPASHGLVIQSLDDGLVQAGRPARFVALNVGSGSARPHARLSGSPGFRIVHDGCSKDLAPRARCSIEVGWIEGAHVSAARGALILESGRVSTRSELRSAP